MTNLKHPMDRFGGISVKKKLGFSCDDKTTVFVGKMYFLRWGIEFIYLFIIYFYFL